MAKQQVQSAGGGAETSNLSLLDTIVHEGNMAVEASQADYAKKLIGQFAVQILDEGMKASPDQGVVDMINQRIAQIDELMSKQMNAIMHAPEFQALESSWRGLHDMVANTETSTRLKLRLLNITKKELLRDLEKAVDHDMSSLFKKIYEEEYGTFGGHPYSCLIGDYYFGRHPQDITLLDKISHVAAAAHAPFISSASPALFDMKRFTDLSVPRDLSKIFESGELDGWRSFRDGEDSRYVALTLPRYALRLPYGAKTIPVENFNFEEDVDGRDHDKYLWGNAAYLVGLRLTDAFAKYSWTTAIRGVEGGGKVESMKTHKFLTDEGDIAVKCPTEVTITDRREKELNDLGFLSVVHAKGTDFAGPGNGERPSVISFALYTGGVTFRTLPKSNYARQNR